MVYISADGSLSKQAPPSNNPLKKINNAIHKNPLVSISLVAVVAIAASKLDLFSPLANGKIPAAKKQPNEHWSYIQKDLTFVRSHTEGLSKVSKSKTESTSKETKKILDEHHMEMRFIEKVDFGGMDGHVAEATDMLDVEEIRVTRCSTTRSAVTAYFCGADVATNQDVSLGNDGKLHNYGTKSFRQYLECRHEQGVENNGTFHRSVFRLGVGCKDNLAGYSHAFSIVGQPDGTYYWLQSYIGHYSLSTWMKKADLGKQSTLAGVLTFDELTNKLDTVNRLMRIESWTSQANADYLDLFNVDKDLLAASGNRGRKIKKWTEDHRLSSFVWDEACIYPVPTKDDHPTEGEEGEDLPGSNNDGCSQLLSPFSIKSLMKDAVGLGDGVGDELMEEILESLLLGDEEE